MTAAWGSHGLLPAVASVSGRFSGRVSPVLKDAGFRPFSSTPEGGSLFRPGRRRISRCRAPVRPKGVSGHSVRSLPAPSAENGSPRGPAGKRETSAFRAFRSPGAKTSVFCFGDAKASGDDRPSGTGGAPGSRDCRRFHWARREAVRQREGENSPPRFTGSSSWNSTLVRSPLFPSKVSGTFPVGVSRRIRGTDLFPEKEFSSNHIHKRLCFQVKNHHF